MSTDAIVEVCPTRYRRLRIAWTVTWGVVAVVLVVMWVRTYCRIDGVTVKSATGTYVCYSAMGHVEVGWVADGSDVFGVGPRFDLGTSAVNPASRSVSKLFWPWFQFTADAIVIPHWFLTMLTAVFAAIAWLPFSKRFSLRALLIVMTLVAVGLGAIIWARG